MAITHAQSESQIQNGQESTDHTHQINRNEEESRDLRTEIQELRAMMMELLQDKVRNQNNNREGTVPQKENNGTILESSDGSELRLVAHARNAFPHVLTFAGLGRSSKQGVATTVRDFIRSMESTLELANLPIRAQAIFAAGKLTDAAATWYAANSNIQKEAMTYGWSSLKVCLLKEFEGTFTTAQQMHQLVTMRQGEKGILIFNEEFKHLLPALEGLRSDAVVGLYVNALNQKIGTAVKSNSANMTNLEAAMAAASLQELHQHALETKST
ncbi:hypothetical protein HMI55_000579 [Coelomomyces lativittatus]|nr:hypothetical protein HMI55_000579 [Coelomomyces lativittatus]